MNVSNALSGLMWRFKKSFTNDDGTRRKNVKAFYPTEKDLKNLDVIISWVDNQKTISLNSNRIFAKLFLELFMKEIWRTSSYDMALENVQMHLKTSLESKYKTFQREIMMFNFDQACDMLNMPSDLNYSKGVSTEQRINHTKERLKFVKSHSIELKKDIISNHWDEENTRLRLNDLLTDMINTYNGKS